MGTTNDGEIIFRVKINDAIFEKVTNGHEIVINDMKVRVVLFDVCEHVEKLINKEWPSIVDLGYNEKF